MSTAEERRAALALAAPIVHAAGGSPATLGGFPALPYFAFGARSLLAQGGIADGEGLTAALDGALLDAADAVGPERAQLGLGLMRTVAYAGWGAVLGWISHERAWELVLAAGARAREAFASWDELADEARAGAARGGRVRMVEAVDAMRTDPLSPWRVLHFGGRDGETPGARRHPIESSAVESFALEVATPCGGCLGSQWLSGIAARVPCARCGEVLVLAERDWRRLIALDVAAARVSPRGVLHPRCDSATYSFAGRMEPRCACGAELPVAELLELLGAGVASASCPRCEAAIALRPPDELARAVHPLCLGVVVPSVSRRASARDAAPVVASCATCRAPIAIDGTTRMVRCPACRTSSFVPGSLWFRFHPRPSRRRFYLLVEEEPASRLEATKLLARRVTVNTEVVATTADLMPPLEVATAPRHRRVARRIERLALALACAHPFYRCTTTTSLVGGPDVAVCARDCRSFLIEHTGCSDAAALRAYLASWLGPGLAAEHAAYVAVARRELAAERLQSWPDHTRKTALVAEELAAGSAQPLTAWAAVHLIALARAGYAAAWLEEDDAWGHILPAAQRLLDTFDSFAAVSRDFLAGCRFAYGHGAAYDGYVESHTSLLADTSSCWSVLPWPCRDTCDAPAELEHEPLVWGWLRLALICTDCQNPVPVHDLEARVTCPECQADQGLDDEHWCGTLAAMIDGVLRQEPGERSSCIDLGRLPVVKAWFGRRAPHCPRCDAALDDLGPRAAAFDCPTCGTHFLLRPADVRARSFDPRLRALLVAVPAPGATTERCDCGACGATLAIDGSARVVACDQCGAQVVVPPRAWLALHPPRRTSVVQLLFTRE